MLGFFEFALFGSLFVGPEVGDGLGLGVAGSGRWGRGRGAFFSGAWRQAWWLSIFFEDVWWILGDQMGLIGAKPGVIEGH